MLEELKYLFENSKIEDIYTVGFVDVEGEEYQYYPLYNYLFIELGNKIIRLEANQDNLRLSFKIVDGMDYQFEIDEEMLYAKSSINTIVLDDIWSSSNNVKEVLFYGLDELSNSCLAAEIILLNGQVIFLDPSYEFGINIGGERLKEAWKDNCSGAEKIKLSRICIS